MATDDTYAALEASLAAHGLSARGGFVPKSADGVPEAGQGATAAVVLVGNAGPALWPHFAAHAASGPNALDRWTRTTIAPIAARFGARAVYPFDTPPLPFQRWAMKAEPVAPSPLGVLIHPDHGLWHAYRAALLFPRAIALPPWHARPRPCDTCTDKPCLSACPVGAFTGQSYDVPACAGHLDSLAGASCLDGGCLARGACPVGEPYAADQLRFHMAAFHRAVTLRSDDPESP